MGRAGTDLSRNTATGRRWIAVILIAALAAAGWWFARGGAGPAAGMVTLTWRGNAVGRATLPGRIAWCPVTRMATLNAISNDTGLLVTLQENDSIALGPHQVVSPAIRAKSPRPNATAAMRWVRDTTAILGFASVSGVVDLQTVGTAASGTMNMLLLMPGALDTIRVTGVFRDLPVVASAVGCP